MKNIKKKEAYKEYHKTLEWQDFLKFVKPYTHIRVGVIGGEYPFVNTYFKINKRELLKIVKNYKCDVLFDAMLGDNKTSDIMFIKSIKQRILED